jgi:hypothetical protein
LIEGNHRLAFARNNNIPYVPVKIVISHNTMIGFKTPAKVNNKNPICASCLGFKTYSSFPNHPYLSKSVSSSLLKQKLVDPYEIGYEIRILEQTHPELL